MTVYVGNLSYELTEADLTNVFADYGDVKQVKMPLDRETGGKRGFAFIDMESASEEAAAIEELDGAEWMGRTLKVNKARPRPDRKPSGSGNWGNH